MLLIHTKKEDKYVASLKNNFSFDFYGTSKALLIISGTELKAMQSKN